MRYADVFVRFTVSVCVGVCIHTVFTAMSSSSSERFMCRKQKQEQKPSITAIFIPCVFMHPWVRGRKLLLAIPAHRQGLVAECSIEGHEPKGNFRFHIYNFAQTVRAAVKAGSQPHSNLY